MSVFADTSALYAAMVRTEDRHHECLNIFKKLIESGRSLRTTSYVLLETTALLQHRIGISPVRDFDEHILPLLSVRWVSEELHRQGMKRLMRENKRSLSLTDCVSFEFMKSEGIRDAFALDRHFSDAGFQLLVKK
jgi:predicted nucleic acid-binding protein